MAWTQRIHDAFTDADFTGLASHTPDQGGAWTVLAGDVGIFGSQLYSFTNPTFALNAQTLAAKQAAEIAIGDRATSPAVVVLGAWDGSNATGYYAFGNAFGTEVGTFTGSGVTRSALATDSTAWANADVIRLEADGSGGLAVLRNGSPLLTTSDATYPSGSAGLGLIHPGSSAADEFFAYDDAGGGGSAAGADALHHYLRTVALAGRG